MFMSRRADYSRKITFPITLRSAIAFRVADVR